MLRIVLLISLLASLIFMIRQFTAAPLPEVPEGQARARTRAIPPPAGAAGFGQKPVMRPAPEVYDGYLFVEERKLDEADFGEFGGGGQETSEANAADLEQVFYSGSLIVGDRRQGLVTYQDNSRGGSQPNRNLGRGRGGAAEARPAEQSKVLEPGDRFMGYLVAAIEPEKIVFEKGGEKVDKFLFDQNKKRPAVAAAPRPAPTPGQGGVSAAVVTPPVNLPPAARTAPAGEIPLASSPSRRAIRSRRLQRVYPQAGLPAMPVAPGRSVSPNN